MAKLVLLNKPYNVLSQFTDTAGRETLASYIDIPNVYPAGRLDATSEGLLLLTDDGQLQYRISHPKKKLEKTYLVQVEGEITDNAVLDLCSGITLKDGRTRPAKVRKVSVPELWERSPPIRYRQTIPTCWLELTIKEGRNRQVRRMTAAAGYPTLRLVRIRIGIWSLGSLQPGAFQVLNV